MNTIITHWLTTSRNNILTQGQRSTHTYVIGQSGTGKSRAMESWILQDILAGHGVGVIDPHGDLYHRIVFRLTDYPAVWHRVVLIDPFEPNWAVSINPLQKIPGLPLERTSAFMTDVMMKIWGISPTSAPRMLWLITNTFLALADLNLTLLELPRFLQNADYRNQLIPRISFANVRSYFESEFPTTPGMVNQWTAPVLNKIGALVFDPDIRPILAGGKTLDLRAVLDGQKILLVNLSKGLMGDAASALIGAFLIARMQQVALSRADSNHRIPFYLYLDEFQHYTTNNIKDILSESRKYGLSLTFAHQYLHQISDDILQAVINTAGTIVSFRVGYQDASILAKEMFPVLNNGRKQSEHLEMKFNGTWPKLAIQDRKETTNWEKRIRYLTSLRKREFWVKRREDSRSSKQHSWDMPNIVVTHERKALIAQLIELTGQIYGQDKNFLQTKIAYRSPKNDSAYNAGAANHIPLWDA